MTEPKKLARGDRVRIRLNAVDDWREAYVLLASQTDPSSVMLLLEDGVPARGGLILGSLPLIVDYAAETVTSLFGGEYEIEVAE